MTGWKAGPTPDAGPANAGEPENGKLVFGPYRFFAAVDPGDDH